LASGLSAFWKKHQNVEISVKVVGNSEACACSKPAWPIAELEIWMRQQRALLSTKNDTAKAINYIRLTPMLS
jgi:hypothetical protein